MSYAKRGKAQKKPYGSTRAEADINDDKKRAREESARFRRMFSGAGMLGVMGPSLHEDHLPGSAADRFGGVYRKGGVRDGVDQPSDEARGRGYTSDGVR